MELTIGARGYGFTIIRTEYIEEAGGTLIEMVHEATGARLLWMKSEEKNKLFSVAFKTVPETSTGVFHILEHSVLAGSEKYPVREPFLELLKSSMQTFLNAITFPDKTVYPISSRNEQDFLNLTEVYLDAVFAPAILTNPNIFYQEGWHIELDENGAPSYKGVVLNEMKGATSSVDEQIGQNLVHMLFGDTCYGFNSGGDPKVIPTLTYEKFCSEYHRYYSASNAYFYLDGDIPFDRTMALIESYLEKQTRVEGLPEIPVVTKAPTPDVLTEKFAIGPNEALEDQAHLTLGKLTGRYDDKERQQAIAIICDVLAGSNEAPLTKAILASGLAQNVELYLQDGVLQPYLSLCLKNTNEDKFDQLKALVYETLRKIGEEGLSKSALIATINTMEFSVRQPREPQGLIRGFRSLSYWLYGGDPRMGLMNKDCFREMRAMVQDGRMDELFKEVFLGLDGVKELRMLPSKTLIEELQEEENARLAAITSTWTEEDFAACRELNEKLVKWQATPDSPEQLATLPVLDLSEVDTKVEWVGTEEGECEGVKTWYHPLATNGIVHLRMYFSLGDMSLQDLTKLSLLPEFLENLATEHFPEPLKLQEALKTYLGSLSFDIAVYGSDEDTKTCKPYMVVKCSVLRENLAKAFELIPEILLTTSFADKDSIRNILLQMNETAKQMLIGRGNAYAMMMAQSAYSAKAAVGEAIAGYTRDSFTRDLVKDLERKMDGYTAYLGEAMEKMFVRKRLTVSITSDEPADLSDLLKVFPEGESVPEVAAYQIELPDHAAVQIPAQIGYAASAYHLSKMGRKVNGSLAVMGQILSLDYLWNRVRVQGGAYGTGLRTGKGGDLTTYSYRDPDPAGSLKVYAAMADALCEFLERGEGFDKYIISTVSDMDPLLMPVQKGAGADARLMNGVTREETEKALGEMLHTTKEDLLAWADVLREMARKGRTAVVAHEAALSALEGFERLN